AARRRLPLPPRLLALALTDQRRARLAAVGLHERHLERRRVEAVLGRLVAGRRGDRLPLERPERVEQVVDRRGLRRALAALDQLPVALAAALDHDGLAARPHAHALAVARLASRQERAVAQLVGRAT